MDLSDIEATHAVDSDEIVEDHTLHPGRTTPTHGSAAQELHRIGRYPVLGKLGEGGMGAVYAAYDEELDRRIAIKLLIRSGGPKDERNRARVRREALAMARLSHPAVAHVYEVGEFEGLTYIAMEYVRGTTLRAWAEERRTLDERLDALVQAGRGLVAAHRAGVVHRDFKPDNVMVDRHGRARVLDFGLAQAHDDASVERTEETFGPPGLDSLDQLGPELTRAGTVMGTPSYMSPEQHLGAPTSPATDQYSFSAVAYELLHGVRPYQGPNRLAIAYAIHRNELTPPPADDKLPLPIRQVVMRGLAKDPAARWPSMEALVDALEAARGTQKRPWLLPLLGGAAIVIIAVLAGLLLVRPDPPPAELSAVEAVAQSAIAAGAQARWVYPEPTAPLDTALVRVHELDALAESEHDDEALAAGAAARAAALRADFGAALLRLGDYYWEREGGRPFARDFYLQAALFDAGLGHARERSGFTNGELADLRARALDGQLTGAELDAGRELAELAAVVPEPGAAAAPVDEAAVQQRLAQATGRRRAARADELEAEAGPRPVKVPAAGPEVAEPEPPEPEVEPEVAVEPELEPEAAAEPEVDEAAREAARKESATLVAEGDRLRAAGKTGAAESKYFAALRVNGRSAPAHDGLRRIKFDAGRYAEAVPHAEKAARYAPGSARYRRTLGDVYFKVGRLQDAEAAYSRAVALGDDKAQDRLALVRKKLGG